MTHEKHSFREPLWIALCAGWLGACGGGEPARSGGPQSSTNGSAGTSVRLAGDTLEYARGWAVRTTGSQLNSGRYCANRNVRWIPLLWFMGGK